MANADDVANVRRRKFLKGASLAGAAAFATPLKAMAQERAATPAGNSVPLPNRAAETAPPPALAAPLPVAPASRSEHP